MKQRHKKLAIIDLGWGDNGKGIISYTDASQYDISVRFQGGPNAGHTIYINNIKYVFHSIPCGALYPDKICVIAGCCVINPENLICEIETIKDLGIHLDGRFYIYSTATIITPCEIALDNAKENARKKNGTQIGTTRNGIGPAYGNRADRVAIIAQDLLNPEILKKKIYNLTKNINPILISLGAKKVSPKKIFDQVKTQANKIAKYIVPNTYISKLLKEEKDIIDGEKSIIFEGAQGILLDTFNGTYPYVTSFSTHPGIIGPSCGINTKDIYIIGVTKAYVTRVGEGPFPTEIGGEEENKLREIGHEYGATTGRPRRCGWTDLPLIRYAIAISGINEITMTCFDILYKMSKIKICTRYIMNGQYIETAHSISSAIFSKAKPIYEDFFFDDTDITGINNWDDLPKPAQEFIKKIQSHIDTPITRVKTGPNPEDILEIPQI